MKDFGKIAAALLFSTAMAGSVSAQEKPADVNFDCALFDECGQSAPSADPAATTGPAVRQSGNVRGGFTLRREPVTAARPATTTTSRPSASAAPTSRPARIARPSATLPAGRMESERIRAGQMVTFVSGSAALSPQARAVAQQMAKAMLRPDKVSVRFRIEGHTDAVGSRDRNLELSRQRAQAVVAYLGTLGVDAKRLEAVGLGFDQPIPGVARTSAANRRVVAKPIG